MKTICAWCNDIISEESGKDKAISHGICETCYSTILTSSREDLKDSLDNMKIPILVIEDTGRALYSNNAAESLLGMKSDEISGRLGGEIFECIHSREPGGCGNTIHCKSCTIRNSVEHTFATGESLINVPATLKILPESTILDASSFITTIRKEVTKDDFIVCLSIKDFAITREEGTKENSFHR